MVVAFHSSDVPVAEEALLSYWELPLEEQVRLEELHSFLHPCLKYLLEITNYRASSSTPSHLSSSPLIQNWLEWFDVADKDPDNPELMTSLDPLSVSTDYRCCNQEKLKIFRYKLLSSIIVPR